MILTVPTPSKGYQSWMENLKVSGTSSTLLFSPPVRFVSTFPLASAFKGIVELE